MKLLHSLLLSVSLALCAPAIQAAPFTLDSTHTSVYFAASHFDRTMVRGRFNKVAGQIDYDEAKRTGSVDISIEVDSVDTGVRTLDTMLKSGQFFEAARFPEIRFQSTRFEFDGERLHAVSGKLTLHGVSLSAQLLATRFSCGEIKVFLSRSHVCGGDFQTTIQRSAFGMERFLPDVGDAVQIMISIEATPARLEQ